MNTSGKTPLLCDTGLLSGVFLNTSPFINAYDSAIDKYQETISTAVYIELQHWLLIQRGSINNSISRAEYDRHRRRLDNFILLNSDGVSEQAIAVAQHWPDSGVGAAYTIATALEYSMCPFLCSTQSISGGCRAFRFISLLTI